MVGVKLKLPKEVETIEIVDNGRLKRIPTYINIEATYWEKECLKARRETANANRGIARLVRGRNNLRDRNTEALCKQAHAHGVIEGATKALAKEEGKLVITEKYNIKKGGE